MGRMAVWAGGVMLAWVCGWAQAGEDSREQAALSSARKEASLRAQRWLRLEAPQLRLALAQREAELARSDEAWAAKEKIAFAAFALSMMEVGKLSAERFWEIAPAPAPILQGGASAAFSDGSTLRIASGEERALTLSFEGLSANACRALIEAALERALDSGGPSDPFRRHVLAAVEIGRQTLESLSFAQAGRALAPPDGLAAQWLAATPGPAAEAALRALGTREWDPCAQLLPGESVALRFLPKPGRRAR